MRRLLRRALSLGSVSALFLACAAPTLPLPPPATPFVTTAGLPAGKARLSSVGGAEPNSYIITINDDPSVPDDQRVGGAQADGNGTWDATVSAFSGDVIEIYDQVGTEQSPPIMVQIP